MELKQLEAFVKVADLKSFSKAAQALFLTQPTISAHIGSLEKELGVKLFERTTKSLRLTAEGERVYPIAGRMVDLRDTLLTEISPNANKKIVIGASTIPSGYILPDIVSDFMKLHQGVNFMIKQGDSDQVSEMVEDGTVEVGICGNLPTGRNLVSEKLFKDEIVIVTPNTMFYRNMAEDIDKDGQFRKLLSQPVIVREDGSGTQQAVNAIISDRFSDINLNVIARNNDVEAIKRMVSSGVGISIMSYLSVREMEAQGKLKCFTLPEGGTRYFWLVYKKDRAINPLLDNFIRFLRNTKNEGV